MELEGCYSSSGGSNCLGSKENRNNGEKLRIFKNYFNDKLTGVSGALNLRVKKRDDLPFSGLGHEIILFSKMGTLT